MSGPNNPLAMSDEDFLKLNDPSQVPGSEEPTPEPEEEEGQPAEEEEAEVEETEEEETPEGETDENEEEAEEGGEEEPTKSEDEAESEEGEPAASEAGTQEKPSDDDASAEAKAKEEEETEAPVTDKMEAETFFKEVTTPFKANGKTIQVKNAEEAITLMQMGANYTKKMQDIQPHRKVLMMLEDNGLLDQAKLGYLLDIQKGDKAAITKLLKDTGVDPMDIDTESDPEYLGGNHQISDKQANFREAVQEVAQSDSGKETLQIIDGWDDASKDAVWDNPEILRIVQSQRDNGVYDQIVGELERRKTLGQIPANTPFLQAYTQIGDQLFSTAKPDQGEPTPPKVKVAEKVAKPKPKVTNGDKASAAAPARSAPRKTGQVTNPLAMSDEEFAKIAGIQI